MSQLAVMEQRNMHEYSLIYRFPRSRRMSIEIISHQNVFKSIKCHALLFVLNIMPIPEIGPFIFE